jgi:excisionase family DNA binding protein
MKEWLTVPEVARQLGVSSQTVRNWIRRQKLTAIRGVERGAYRIPGPEIAAFKRRNATRIEPSDPLVKTRHPTSPETFFQARIAPTLEQADEPSADALLVRVAAEESLRQRFPTFARDYAQYVGQVAAQLESAAARGETAVTAAIPSRAQRVAARQAMLAFTARRQRPGSGSMLHEMMKGRRPAMEWWGKAARLLLEKDIQIAVTGAVAANVYMPPRHTGDLDVAVPIADLADAGKALMAGGWKLLGNLSLYEDLAGTAWRLGRRELDLIGLPGAWGSAAIGTAQGNRAVSDLPTLTLPYVVAMKLISARPQDSADISRMLGPAPDDVLNAVREVVKRWRASDADDLEQLIAAGRLEFGPR